MRRYFAIPSVFLLFAYTLSGCTSLFWGGSEETAKIYQKSGSIVISKPIKAPLVESDQHSNKLTLGQTEYVNSMGFLPSRDKDLIGGQTESKIGARISLTDMQMSLYSDKGQKEIKFSVSSKIAPGLYRVIHKQADPLWYAGDEYFNLRQLTAPPSGSKLRYLKGALGSRAIFIDRGIAIHDSRIESSDVGGLRVSSKDATSIYKSLTVGDSIIVEARAQGE